MSLDFSEVRKNARHRAPAPDVVDELGNVTEASSEGPRTTMSEADAKALLERAGMKDADRGVGLYVTLTRNETAYDGFRNIFRMMSEGPFPMPDDHVRQIRAALSQAEADLDAARRAFSDYLGLTYDADRNSEQMLDILESK